MIVKSLSRMINESDIARVTDVYYDLQSCRAGLEKTLPDVLLLDIGLPDGDGVDFCGEINLVENVYNACKHLYKKTKASFVKIFFRKLQNNFVVPKIISKLPRFIFRGFVVMRLRAYHRNKGDDMGEYV